MKKYLVLSILCLLPLAVFAQPNGDIGGVERYAIYVGSNNGGKNNQRLLYAGSDAIAFQRTMSEIGGIPQSNGMLLLDPTKSDLDNAIQVVSDKIRLSKEKTKRSEFLFYYSGHSDENALLLGKSAYDYSQLKAAITNVPSDVHVVILDSCFSGNFIRTKGGQRKKPFLMDDSSVVKGHAYLSSSSSQESSQESDEIGSSFFTNAMLTGLRGAADSSGDKKVTLNELYSYAFNETLSKTENSSAGPQHPNYNITLVGSGDLVLSDISASDCVVLLPTEMKGRVIIRDKNGKLVSEVKKSAGSPIYLALEKGSYTATLAGESSTLQGSFSLDSKKVYELSEKSLSQVARSRNRLRGSDFLKDGEEEPDLFGESDFANFPSFEEQKQAENIGYNPVDLSFATNELSSSIFPDKDIMTNLSLGLVSSRIYRVDGAMLTFGTNEAVYMRGAQLAFGYNKVDHACGFQGAFVYNMAEDIRGVQSAYIFNKAKYFEGIQGSYIYNTANHFKGIQGAVVFNRTNDFQGGQGSVCVNMGHDFIGLQGTVGANIAHDFNGVQGSVGANIAHDINGIQGAVGLNSAKNVEGVQAAVVNYATEINESSAQIGIINIADECNGIQLGILNLSKNGLLEFGSSFSTDGALKAVLNSGQKRLYSVCYLGGTTFTDKTYALAGLGLGTRLEWKKFNLDCEVLANWFYYTDEVEIKIGEDDEVEMEFFPSCRLSVGYAIVKHLRLFAGASASLEYRDNAEAFEKQKKNIKIDLKDDVKLYPEFDFGLKFSLN